MNVLLVDTGPMVAYLDRGDGSHAAVADVLLNLPGKLATTSAVVTESMYFLSKAERGPRLLAELIEVGEIEVYDFSRPPKIQMAAELMEKYADTPMDFADATLMLLADETGAGTIITLDWRGFLTYRTSAGTALEILPSR